MSVTCRAGGEWRGLAGWKLETQKPPHFGSNHHLCNLVTVQKGMPKEADLLSWKGVIRWSGSALSVGTSPRNTKPLEGERGWQLFFLWMHCSKLWQEPSVKIFFWSQGFWTQLSPPSSLMHPGANEAGQSRVKCLCDFLWKCEGMYVVSR